MRGLPIEDAIAQVQIDVHLILVSREEVLFRLVVSIVSHH